VFYPTNTLNWATNSYGIFKIEVDFYGQDLIQSIQPTFDDCLASCAATPTCTHLCYSILPVHTCWLKSGPQSQSSAINKPNVQAAILNQSKILK
jgi:hypothetical protein